MKNLKFGVLLCSALTIAGCAQQGGTLDKPKPMRYIAGADGCIEGVGTAGTSLDASGTTQATFCPDVRSPTGWARAGTNRVITDTTGGKIATQAAGIFMGTGAGMIRDKVHRNSSDGCEDGNCGGDTFVLQGGNAQAVNSNVVDLDANVNACTFANPCS